MQTQVAENEHVTSGQKTIAWRLPRACLLGLLLSVLLLAAGCFIGVNDLAAWLQHPAMVREQQAALRNAAWLKVMMVIAGLVGAAASIYFWRQFARQLMPRHDVTPSHRLTAPTFSPLHRSTILFVLCLVAVAFRLPRLTESLWYDEAALWLAYGSGVSSAGPIMGNYFDPVNHVLHTLLTVASVNRLEPWLGAEVSMRLPSFVFSIAAVPAMFGLLQRVCTMRVAAIAAFLMAVFPIAALEGVEARGYSMMMFFAICSTWALVAGVQSFTAGAWLGYSLLLVAGCWTHMMFVFVPIGHAAWLMTSWMQRRIGWSDVRVAAVSFTLATVLTLMLYSPIFSDIMRTRRVFAEMGESGPNFFGVEGIHMLLQLGGSWSWRATMPGLALAGFGIVVGARSGAGSRSTLTAADAAMLMLCGLPLLILAAVVSGSWMYARFGLFALPGSAVFIALAIDWMWERRLALGIGAIAIVAVASIIDLTARPPKQPLRDAADFVRASSSEDDRVLVIGLAHEVLRTYIHDRELHYSLWHGRDLQERLADVRPNWIVVEYRSHVPADRYQKLRDAGFARELTLRGWVDWGHGDIEVWRKRETP